MITVTCPGLDELTKTLEKSGKMLTKTYDEVLAKLVDEAKDIADKGFGEAEMDVHPDDYEKPFVSAERVGLCNYVITAHSKQVMFLEFGAGYTTDMFGFSKDVDIPVYPGSWSVKDKRQWTRRGYWRSPNGHFYDSIPPTRAMFNASQFLLYRLQSGDLKLSTGDLTT